jgi:hypothetical protein
MFIFPPMISYYALLKVLLKCYIYCYPEYLLMLLSHIHRLSLLVAMFFIFIYLFSFKLLFLYFWIIIIC